MNGEVAEVLREIDEIDRRKIWARLGHPSMFDFCVVRFHMSESRAYKRIGAARLGRRFPAALRRLSRPYPRSANDRRGRPIRSRSPSVSTSWW